MAKEPDPIQVHHQQNFWDAEYKIKGRLWGRVPLEPTAGTGKGIFLDLGCGDGKNLRRQQTGSIQIGLDFSLEALHLCKKIPDLSGISLICADVRYLPIKDNTVDSSDAHHLLGHLSRSDREAAAHEISRILILHGVLVITVFGSGDFREGTGVEIEPGTYMKGTGIITHYFSEKELQQQFPKLECLSIEPHTWEMRVKGKTLPRVLWTITYRKSGSPV